MRLNLHVINTFTNTLDYNNVLIPKQDRRIENKKSRDLHVLLRQ